MDFDYLIGVDVSKKTLDVALLEKGTLLWQGRTENTKRGVRGLFTQLSKSFGVDMEKSLVCMEHTGIYNNPILWYLQEKGIATCLESAVQIKRSGGIQRGKNDRVDALRIAQYAYRQRDAIKLWKPKRKVMERLEALTALRRRLIGQLKEARTAVNEQKDYMSKEIVKEVERLCRNSVATLAEDLKNVEERIKHIVREDERLSELYGRVTSVDGVGMVTAIEVILTTNEFEGIRDPKKFACYSGVAPFEHQSGTSIRGRTRVSNMANKTMKATLHMAALSAIIMKGEMREYYLRKVMEGKNKLLVVNAVRNKLVHRIFACVKQNRNYDKTYTNALA